MESPQSTSSSAATQATGAAGAAPGMGRGSVKPPGKGEAASRNLDAKLAQLPPYARSLLKVKVPVHVTLASTRLPLKRVLDLSPGSIIQFDKPCDEPLALEVGDQTVAVGEAVKVGEKFGLWITAMARPGERFWILSRHRWGRRVK